MGHTRPAPVLAEVALTLVAPDGVALEVQATLRYEPADPYAVHVVFAAAEGVDEPSVSWSFARQLLVDGLQEPAGIGDVRVWPWSGHSGPVVALALTSPDGHALFEVPRPTLEDFLRRTFDEVPAGAETAQLNLDAVVGALLRR
ncbi:MAG TPA: SsgA family sporulation/cell division regulator [Mycobacteriales bacterium]|jgi:hypothetical protein